MKKFKNENLIDNSWNFASITEGSVAVQVEESFDAFMDELYGFNQFQKNLSQLKGKVSQLSFMVDEVQSALER